MTITASMMQIPELAQLQQQLYDELSRTPEQGPAFTNVVKALLERETAFVKWKSEGAAAYWEASGPGPQPALSCKQAMLCKHNIRFLSVSQASCLLKDCLNRDFGRWAYQHSHLLMRHVCCGTHVPLHAVQTLSACLFVQLCCLIAA